MTDITTQPAPTASYVDDYAPPANQAGASDTVSAAQPSSGVSSAPVSDDMGDMSQQSGGSQGSMNDSESLEDQNIFDLLGISEANDTEKEEFLDELQQVIWEDFVDKDVELLLTEDELKEFKVIMNNEALSEDDRQAEMIDFLEKLIPDLEKIMLEKALDLKEDMTRQRISEYTEHFVDDQANLDLVKQAQKFADDQQWKSVAKILNSISA